MALRFFDGGGLHYNTCTDKWDQVSHGGGAGSSGIASVDTGTNGRWGGRCLYFQRTGGATITCAIGTNLSGGLSEYVVQLAYKIVSLSAGHFIELIAFNEGSTNHVGVRFNYTNQTITVCRNGTVLGTSANNAWSLDTWGYLQVRVKVHDTTGTIDLVHNGATIFALTGQDTRNAATGIVDVIWLGVYALSTSSTWLIRMQDVAICDVTGSAPLNAIHGEGRVRLLQTVAEGTTIDWSPSTGTDNEALVDEIPHNGDTDYNEASAVNNLDLFTLDNLPLTPTTIYGVSVSNMVSKTDAGTDGVASVVRSGAANYVGTTRNITGATYQRVLEIWETDPATAAAWTKSGVDALEIGVKRVS